MSEKPKVGNLSHRDEFSAAHRIVYGSPPNHRHRSSYILDLGLRKKDVRAVARIQLLVETMEKLNKNGTRL